MRSTGFMVLIRVTLSPMFQGMTGTLAALLTFFIVATAAPQGGSIRGKVVADIPDQRRTLPGVVVTLSSDRLGDRQLQAITDHVGVYAFPGLVAGDYVITIEYTGFKKYEKKISIQIDATVEHDALLQPLPLSETVTVRDDPTDAARTESTAP